MKRSTLEWIEKAEADHATALRELRARRLPNFDDACFHSQQCSEKYLKASLNERGIPFPKTHDLEVLLDLMLPHEPAWNILRPRLNELTSFAIAFRYPGQSATRTLAKRAIANCGLVRDAIRLRLGI